MFCIAIAFQNYFIISCNATQKLPIKPSTFHCLKHNKNDSGGCLIYKKAEPQNLNILIE